MKGSVASLMVLFILAACKKPQQCPPCTQCNATVRYVVIKTGTDTLRVSYSTIDTAHYEGCGLYATTTAVNKIILNPGTYTMDGNAFIGAEVRLLGESEEKGWTLRVLSSSGAVLGSTDNEPYREDFYPPNYTVYSNSVHFFYH